MMGELNQYIEYVLDFDYQHLTTDDSDGRSFYFALKRLEDYYENLKEDESGIVFKTQDDQGVRIWLHAQDHLTEENPKAPQEPTVHLAEIQAMLDDGLPVYIEINADIPRRWLYDFAMITDVKTMAGDIIKLTRDSITYILGIPMINAQSYLWPTDTFRAIIPVEDVGYSSGCSKCAFDKSECHDIDCFDYYYEYRKVITDGHKGVEDPEVEEKVYTMDFVGVSTSGVTCDGCAFQMFRTGACNIPLEKRPCTLSTIMKFKE